MGQSTNLEIERQMTEARHARDLDTLVELALEAFTEDCNEEDLLAWVSRVVYEEDLAAAFDVIPQFVKDFPNSRHGVRVLLADIHAEAGEVDRCTLEARHYLAMLDRDGGLAEACADPSVADSVMQALRLLTLAYTAAGARTYSQEIFAYAISLADDPASVLNFEQGIADLERQLHEFDYRESDFYWRAFLREGENYAEVAKACDEVGLPALRERVDFIHSLFAGDPDYELPQGEPVLLMTD